MLGNLFLSYSRVLGSLAADILVRIDDLLHMDELLPINKDGVRANTSTSDLFPIKGETSCNDLIPSVNIIPFGYKIPL